MCIAFSAHWLSVKTEAFNENIRAKSFLKVAEMQLNPTTLKKPKENKKEKIVYVFVIHHVIDSSDTEKELSVLN